MVAQAISRNRLLDEINYGTKEAVKERRASRLNAILVQAGAFASVRPVPDPPCMLRVLYAVGAMVLSDV